MESWELIHNYFSSHPYYLTKHHLDSFNDFLDNKIPQTFQQYNPQTHFIDIDTEGNYKYKIDSVKINLVLTGDTFSASKRIFQTIDNYSLTNQVFYLGKVAFKDLISLYVLSKFFITATLYESSSLPLLEAAASGTAIIASDTNPNKEMSRFINVNLFNANNENSLTDIILKIWNNDSLRENQIIENKKNINRYSWINIAKKYVDSFIDINNDYNDKKN